MSTIGDLVTDALTEIQRARAGDSPAGEDMALGVRVLNRLLDLWNADERAVYTSGYADYVLTPSLSPHTIGSGGTFSASRPEAVLDAALNIGGNPASFTPIIVRDRAWYAHQTVPGLTSGIPTDVYYQPEFPLGKLYFWPVPTTAYTVRLWTRSLLAAVVQTDDFSLPSGYQAALTLTLAEELAPSFGQTVAESTMRRARQSRAVVFGNHDEPRRLDTRDSGIPGGQRGSGFNWLNRTTV